MTRIPGAARVAAAIVAAVVVAVVIASAEDDAARPEQQELERRAVAFANGWARLYAGSEPDECRYMSQPACERETCMRVSRGTTRIRGCTPPSAEFRRSFRRANVEEIVSIGRQAAARFTNGAVVELSLPTNLADVWMIGRVGCYGSLSGCSGSARHGP